MALDIISLLFTISIIGAGVYFVKKKFKNDNETPSLFSANDYCDYCGSKLIKHTNEFTIWNPLDYTCPRCGYDCKKPTD